MTVIPNEVACPERSEWEESPAVTAETLSEG